jgi:hypothetical protein
MLSVAKLGKSSEVASVPHGYKPWEGSRRQSGQRYCDMNQHGVGNALFGHITVGFTQRGQDIQHRIEAYRRWPGWAFLNVSSLGLAATISHAIERDARATVLSSSGRSNAMFSLGPVCSTRLLRQHDIISYSPNCSAAGLRSGGA